nr:SLBB domain-containing protein [Pseudopedobacter sp.]
MNIKKFIFTLFLVLGLLLSYQTKAQSINQQNFSEIKVDNLTDAQIKQFMQQFEASGMSQDQLEQAALAKGMKPEEVQKLKARVAQLQSGNKKTTKDQKTSERKVIGGKIDPALNDSTKNTVDVFNTLQPKIFGQELFQNSKITFEPSLRLATPQNYVIGTGDQILIDIYGYSEVSHQLNVSPEGTINIPLAGVTPVGGLTVEAATARIKAKLSKIYSGINSGNTKLSVAIGDISSIKVIVTGEVTKPGTYTLPSIASVFNALYSSGGPSINGSFRNIEVIRGGKKIATLDVYDFLLNGEYKNPIRLQDQDIIRIPTYTKRVQIEGEVKRPAIYEMKANENLSDLLRFAGGFTENAYQARIKVVQSTPTERKISDITSEEFTKYQPQSGGHYFVNEILDRFENRVSIEGAIFRPGAYELEPGLTLKTLIQKAEGLKEDAFLNRGYITRLGTDLQPQMIAFNVKGIMSGTSPDILLQREDQIQISSIFDLKEEYKVQISGDVIAPGEFPYANNMSLEELIIKAGGLKESATTDRVEISRRVSNEISKAGSLEARSAQIFQVNVDKDLKANGASFILQPFDIVVVRSAPGYEAQKQVKIEGEVLYPGTYTITRKNERISDLVKRAGGLTELAYQPGASLKRSGEKTTETEKEQEQKKLSQFKKLQKDIKDTLTVDVTNKAIRNDFVGINLTQILENPGEKEDLFLEGGDIYNVPKQLQTVKVSGEALSPVTIVYTAKKGFKGYVNNAGGFSEKALKRRSYIIYANGTVKSTHKIFLFNSYPSVKPGAEIFIPAKEEKRKLSAGEIVGITTGIASLGAIILTVIRLL